METKIDVNGMTLVVNHPDGLIVEGRSQGNGDQTLVTVHTHKNVQTSLFTAQVSGNDLIITYAERNTRIIIKDVASNVLEQDARGYRVEQGGTITIKEGMDVVLWYVLV